MIKICVDARMLNASGIGTCIKNILPFLALPPFQLSVLVSQPSQELKGIVLNSPIYSIGEQIRFPFTIPACDLFWSPHYNTPIFPIRAKKRIVTIHDVCHLALPNLLTPPKRLIAKWLLKRSAKLSNRIITDSQFSKKEIEKFLEVKPEKIQVIHPGVDGTQFQRRDASAIRKKYQIHNRYFLFVGNLKPHKNIGGLIRSFELFSQMQIEPFTLLLVGKYQGLRSIDASLKSEKLTRNIQILGEIPAEDLPAIYSGAEALVFPSYYEGFGLPPLEAMACGTAVIGSNISSIPEICGDAPYYICPNNPIETATAMKAVANDKALRSELVRKGMERYRLFNWEQTGKEYRSMFEEVHFEKRHCS